MSKQRRPMHALSIWQPFADYCAIGLKPLENRSWCPSVALLDQWVLIHAAKRVPKAEEIERAAEVCRDATGERGLLDPESFALGAVVGAARITGVVAQASTNLIDALQHRRTAELVHSPWFNGPFGWVLEDAVRFPAPIQVSGRQGIWIVPETYRIAIREQMKAVA